MLEEKLWKNGDLSDIFDGLVKKHLNDKGRLEQRPGGRGSWPCRECGGTGRRVAIRALPVELGLSKWELGNIEWAVQLWPSERARGAW